MNIYNIQCFGLNDNFGNKATVIEQSNLSIDERLLFAQNRSTCIFIDNKEDNIILDFYYPHKRSVLCLHGTLAAAYVYFLKNPQKSKLTVTTSIALQKIDIEKFANKIVINVNSQIVDQNHIKLDNEIISKLLNLDYSASFVEYYIASSGSPKLFIEVSSLALLHSLTPNLELINRFSNDNKISGIYVYCKISKHIYHGRNFNHIDPKLEDAATAVAATAMTYHLKQDLVVYQGITNKCVMYTKFLHNTVSISGNVTLIDVL